MAGKRKPTLLDSAHDRVEALEDELAQVKAEAGGRGLALDQEQRRHAVLRDQYADLERAKMVAEDRVRVLERINAQLRFDSGRAQGLEDAIRLFVGAESNGQNKASTAVGSYLAGTE